MVSFCASVGVAASLLLLATGCFERALARCLIALDGFFVMIAT